MLHLVPTPLLAAGFDWLEGLLPLLFVVFWIVSQVVTVIRKAAGGGGRQPEPLQPVPRQPRPIAADRPVAAAGEARSELERQVDEFLQRSGGGPAPSRQPKPRPAGERLRPREAVRSTPPPLPAMRETPMTERHLGPLAAGSDVARHVRDAFRQELRHLAAPLGEDGPDTDGGPTRPATTAAAEFSALLQNPATIRHLILLREVLDRPIERW